MIVKNVYLNETQPSPVWPDLGKFCHFSKIIKVFGNYVRAYLVLGTNLNPLWSTFYAIGQIFIVTNGLIITNNLAIWSHCPSQPHTDHQWIFGLILGKFSKVKFGFLHSGRLGRGYSWRHRLVLEVGPWPEDQLPASRELFQRSVFCYSESWQTLVGSGKFNLSQICFSMEPFSRRRWTIITGLLLSYSEVHEGKHFLFQLWEDYFLCWFTTGEAQLFTSCY